MSLDLKPSHASVKAYYDTLHQFGQLYIDHEGAVRSAFQDLLAKCGRKAKPPLTLVPEYRIERARSSVIVDGALVDLYHLPHGYWEAKDEKDDLAREVERKLDKGYPRDNIIFQAPERAILYQSGARIFDENITAPKPCPLWRPLHHEVGHLPLHLRRSAPSRVSPALLGEPTPRVAPHSVRQRYPRG